MALIRPCFFCALLRPKTFKKIALAGMPTVFTSEPAIQDTNNCAIACYRIKSNECTGFRISNDICNLFSGLIVKKESITTTSEIAYRVQSVAKPDCESHKGFQKVYNHPEVYCFSPHRTKRRYRAANQKCTSRGAHMVFVDSQNKLDAVIRSFGSEKTKNAIWLGGTYNKNTGRWEGDIDGQVLYHVNSTLPLTSKFLKEPQKGDCLVINHPSQAISYKSCTNERTFVCEIISAFD